MIEVPAGLIDPNETPEQCAIRELKEESGYVGEVVEGDFGVSGIMFNGKNVLWIVVILLVFERRDLPMQKPTEESIANLFFFSVI